MAQCGENMFEDVNSICRDCLYDINDENCLSCESLEACTECRVGFYLQKNPIDNKVGCSDCQLRHSEPCLECDKDRCLKCSGSFHLSEEGACEPCQSLEGCAECSDEGCSKCQEGFYMDYKEEKPICLKCSDALNNCKRCNDKEMCLECSKSFFKLHGDGQCRCDGGDRAIIDEQTNNCTC
mmetsp:Transcript_14514/g.24773  ORF Transcript_14514/g.24773 Transcript_14514/m.24773 type:complete len:181 (-) Transcript_14514:526-1068(-)